MLAWHQAVSNAPMSIHSPDQKHQQTTAKSMCMFDVCVDRRDLDEYMVYLEHVCMCTCFTGNVSV
jgi:hypothetical protein